MKLIILAIGTTLMISCSNEVKQTETASTDTSKAVSTTPSTAKTEDWIPVDSATAMKGMMEAGTPGKEQAMLAQDNGNWTAEITMWEKPGAAPTTAKGTMTNKMIMGGRYQVGTFKGNMMGMPFEGTSTTGYDNARKVWVNSWVDNMSTGIMNMEGTWDEGSKSITYKGQMLCPANGKMCDMKQVMTKIDGKTQKMEMYGPDMQTGKQFKNMEMKITKS